MYNELFILTGWQLMCETNGKEEKQSFLLHVKEEI